MALFLEHAKTILSSQLTFFKSSRFVIRAILCIRKAEAFVGSRHALKCWFYQKGWDSFNFTEVHPFFKPLSNIYIIL